ncbi:MAG: DNA repair protein RadA [Candidatus Hydrogenedentes bacterium]|nr:DNA repair protein RadA [Candidatus Hydrogenedentota bacterium]
MARERILFECIECGMVTLRWLGRCPQCDSWDSFVEKQEEGVKSDRGKVQKEVRPIPITDFGDLQMPLSSKKLSSGIKEFDRVIGGGIVQGSAVLIAGEPGIGKSTLALQIAGFWSRKNGKVLYVHGEESLHQIQDRARRLDSCHNNLLMLGTNTLQDVVSTIDSDNFSLVVVDSIQSLSNLELSSVPGSVSQVRECTFELVRKTKEKDIPMIIVGHITKDGYIAGPKVLEHIVDTVLYFDGDGKHSLRLLRANKNRFGSTQEIGVFEMGSDGLKEIVEPSALFLNGRVEGVSGSIVMPILGGTRPMLVEIQALVSKSHVVQPKRGVVGLNLQRVTLLVAVLEKRAGLSFGDRDIFVNVTGGINIDEPAVDLPLIMAILSSYWDIPISLRCSAFGEIGLGGEVRPVNGSKVRLGEIAKFGFQKCFISVGNVNPPLDNDCVGVKVVPLNNIRELIEFMSNMEG